MEILAVIPARGGSKGIRLKNIRPFSGRPLLSYAIEQARQTKRINRVIVSTESEQIAAVAKKYGAEVPFLRPAKFAGDKSPVVPAIIDLLDKLKKTENYIPDVIVLLQTTSPLRTADDINSALDLFFKRRAPAVVTVARTEPLVFTKNKQDKLRLESNTAFLKSTNRQQLPATYKFDGCMVYVIKTATFYKEKTFFPKNTCGHVVPRWRTPDLDEPQDWLVGELLFKNQKKIESSLKNF